MKTKQIFEEYPLSIDEMKEWFLNRMYDSFKDKKDTTPEAFKTMLKENGIKNEQIEVLIESNPRVLFDIFDKNGIIINIITNDSNEFTFKIAEEVNDFYETRKEADYEGLLKMFPLLETKLFDDKNEQINPEENEDI